MVSQRNIILLYKPMYKPMYNPMYKPLNFNYQRLTRSSILRKTSKNSILRFAAPKNRHQIRLTG